MSLDADNLILPLSNLTYPYCWTRVFIGVLVDSDGEKTEVNENNNHATYPVLLDCGESLNECERDLYTCHEDALCVDQLYNLHTKSAGAGYKCVCKPGYKGDGTDCQSE
ncbi:hypothetical protein NP493_1450g01011 [Ridgeia piscesae]|uniref:EGF-like domain-containing protein n=1 Tax=Ridgeia piscesae TaxID=27915 RepID=A0AAD9K3Z2_RIDPI|nr:hypothetical protein NP493_1450g01011 [Ridgeia piscesae]